MEELLIGAGLLHPVQHRVVLVVHHCAETLDVEVGGHLGREGREKNEYAGDAVEETGADSLSVVGV